MSSQPQSTQLIFIRLPEVLRRTALSRSTLYELISDGRFPKPMKLGGGRARINCWPAHEIYDWMQSQMTER